MKLSLTPKETELIYPTKNTKYAWNVYNPSKVEGILLWGYASRGNENYEEEISFFNDQIRIVRDQCEKFNLLAVSVFLPRIASHEYPEYKLNAQMLTPEIMFTDSEVTTEFYNRPDLEILKILEILRTNMKEKGVPIDEKMYIGGVSAGANFANRFSILYPELIKASILFSAGDYIYPTENLNGMDLDYPFGLHGLDNISNNRFNSAVFKSIPHYIYVGEEDHNDPIRWELYYPELIDKYKKALGVTVPERTKQYAEFLKDNGNNVKFRMEPNMAHKIAQGAFEEGFEFITKQN